MLYLFDIDGTLVDTGGAGMDALRETTREIFGHEGPPLDLAGSTDLGIVLGIHDHFNADATDENIARYLSSYQKRLDHNLANGRFPGRVLNGVTKLLESLAKREHATTGLLTGNISTGAASKIRHFGLDPHFPFGAFGSDHHDRNQLGPIALERAAAHTGTSFSPADTWVIGDTPKDIACAKAFGARCLAVATGSFTARQLREFGADEVVETLESAIEIL